MLSGPVPRTVYNELGNGSSIPVTYVSGSYISTVIFGAELPQTFTMCSLTRYTSFSPPYGRIIMATTGALMWEVREGCGGRCVRVLLT